MARAPLVLATRSEGKVRELIALCAAHGYVAESLATLGGVVDPAEDGIEAFDTFAENALAKARWFASRLPGRVILAEDAGLEVDALGGAPGVHSKRWSASALTGHALDAANNARLAEEMRDIEERRARYHCVAMIVDGAHQWRGDGTVEGRIASSPSGSRGFGYDPWFVSDELGVSFGVASDDDKARVSHRARALATCLAAACTTLRERITRTAGE